MTTPTREQITDIIHDIDIDMEIGNWGTSAQLGTESANAAIDAILALFAEQAAGVAHPGLITEKPGLDVGDRIRLERPYYGGDEDFTVEEFRGCLGVFGSNEARIAGLFTPLCDLYECGPDSEQKYIPNYGEYYTNQVPRWMNIPKPKALGEKQPDEEGNGPHRPASPLGHTPCA